MQQSQYDNQSSQFDQFIEQIEKIKQPSDSLLVKKFYKALDDQTQAEKLIKTLNQNLKTEKSLEISQIMKTLLQMKYDNINTKAQNTSENTVSQLDKFQQFQNFKIVQFGKDYKKSTYKLYGEDQQMSMKNWNQTEKMINSPDVIKSMEENLAGTKSEINFQMISDNLRKRLATQQDLQGLCDLKIFQENKKILQPRDRDYLTLMSSELNENDSQNVFSSYGSIPGFTLPFMHKNDDPHKTTIEMNSIIKFLENKKPNLVIIHRGDQQNKLINQLFPPVTFPNTDNKENFHKGIDFLPSQKSLNLGFNIFNLNYDAKNEMDQKEIIKFLKGFPKTGLKIMMISKVSNTEESEETLATYESLTSQLEEFNIQKKDVIIIHSYYNSQEEDDDYHDKDDQRDSVYKCNQVHFIPPTFSQQELKQNTKIINTTTQEIIDLFKTFKEGPSTEDYDKIVQEYQNNDQYITKTQSSQVKYYYELFKQSFDEIDVSKLEQINLHEEIFRSIHYRNLIGQLEEDLNNLVFSPQFTFQKNNPYLKTCTQLINNQFTQYSQDYNEYLMQKDKNKLSNLIQEIKKQLKIHIQNLKKDRKLHKLLYVFSEAVMNSDSALIYTFQDCLANWQKSLLAPFLKNLKVEESKLQNLENPLDSLEKEDDKNKNTKLNQEIDLQKKKIQELVDKIDLLRISIEHFWRELIYIQHETQNIQITSQENKNLLNISSFSQFLNRFTDLVLQGIEFELIDGDLTYINVDFLQKVFKQIEEKQEIRNGQKFKTYIVSIIGPQSTGKSTLMNSLFGTNFQMSAGRCTRGMYASLKFTDVKNARNLLLLDSEGLLSNKKGDSQKFDHLMTVMAMTMSNVLLVNVKEEMDERMRKIIELALYSAQQIKINNLRKPTLQFVLRDMNDSNTDNQIEAIKKIQAQFDNVAKLSGLRNCKNLLEFENEKSFTLMMPAFYNKKYPDEGESLYEWNIMSDFFRVQAEKLLELILSKPNAQEFDDSELSTLQEFIQDSGNKIESMKDSGDLMSLNSVIEVKIKQELSIVVQSLINTFIQEKSETQQKQKQEKMNHQLLTMREEIDQSIKQFQKDIYGQDSMTTLEKQLQQKIDTILKNGDQNDDFMQKDFDTIKEKMQIINDETQSKIRKYFFNVYNQRNDIDKELKEEYENKVKQASNNILQQSLDQIDKIEKNNSLLKQCMLYDKRSKDQLQIKLNEFTKNEKVSDSNKDELKRILIEDYTKKQEVNISEFNKLLKIEEFDQYQIQDKTQKIFFTLISKQQEQKIVNSHHINSSLPQLILKDNRKIQYSVLNEIIQKYQGQNLKNVAYLFLETNDFQCRNLRDFKQLLDEYLKMNQKVKLQQIEVNISLIDSYIESIGKAPTEKQIKEFQQFLYDNGSQVNKQAMEQNKDFIEEQEDKLVWKSFKIFFQNNSSKSKEKTQRNKKQLQQNYTFCYKFRDIISDFIEDRQQVKLYKLFIEWIQDDFKQMLSNLQYDENQVDKCDDMTVSKLEIQTNKIEESYQQLLDKISKLQIDYSNQGFLEQNIFYVIFNTVANYIKQHRHQQIVGYKKKFNEKVEQNKQDLSNYLDSLLGDYIAAQQFIQQYIENLRQQIAKDYTDKYQEDVKNIQITPQDLTKEGMKFVQEFLESVDNGDNEYQLKMKYGKDIKLFTTDLIQFYKERFDIIFNKEEEYIKNFYKNEYLNLNKNIVKIIKENFEAINKTQEQQEDSLDKLDEHFSNQNKQEKYEILGEFLYNPNKLKDIFQSNSIELKSKLPNSNQQQLIKTVFQQTLCPAGIFQFKTFLQIIIKELTQDKEDAQQIENIIYDSYAFMVTDIKSFNDSLNILQRVKGEGGSIGSLTFTLEWRHNCDLDIHVTCSHGKNIYFSDKQPCNECKGELDIDMMSNYKDHKQADGTIGQIENIQINKPTNDHIYKGYINYYSGDNTPVNYKLTISSKSADSKDIKILNKKQGTINPQNEKSVQFQHLYYRSITFQEHQQLYAKEWTDISINKDYNITKTLIYQKFIQHPLVNQILMEANQQ